jgi:chitinase
MCEGEMNLTKQARQFEPFGHGRFGGGLRRKIQSLLFGAVLLLAATNAHAFKVVGYFTSWSAPGLVETLHYDYLTHINYAFLLPTSNGGFTQSFNSTSQLDRIVQLSHNNNVKVLISVGGWNDGDDSAFRAIAASSGLRATFINNLGNFVIAHNLDGVDIDWEFPDSESDNFTLLMSELSTRMKSSGKLLTAAVWGWSNEGVTSSILPYVDFLNLMAYDGGTPHSTYSMAISCLNYWKNFGLPKEKAILGLPFYGSNSSGYQISYSDIVASDSDAPYRDEGGNESSGGYYYNSIPTIIDKTSLAVDQAGGVMIWALNLDTTNSTSLLSAIHEVAPVQVKIPSAPSAPKVISIK